MSSPSPLFTEIDEIEKSLKMLSKDVGAHEEARKRLHALLRAQAAVLESPLETVWRMMMEPHQTSSLRAAMEMGLVESIISNDGPQTATQLAKLTHCDKQLIVRVLRPLTAMKFFDEVALETYAATPRSNILTVPSVGGGFKFMFDIAATSVVHVPRFLKKTGFKNPEGPQTTFQSAFTTKLQVFPWLMEHPEDMSNFNDLMTGQRMDRIEWFNFANVDDILFEGYSEKDGSSTLLVDIGGGRGHDLEAFYTRFPAPPGRLVLQDLPPVIDDITDLHEDIVRMKYDFFTPQPVKSARAYYLRSILHDYSDAKCREILRTIVDAMKPGYSKLLIFEWILPDQGTPLYPALLDINMLALFSGMERTTTQWKELLISVGLEVVNIWTIGKETEGLIEAIKTE